MWSDVFMAVRQSSPCRSQPVWRAPRTLMNGNELQWKGATVTKSVTKTG